MSITAFLFLVPPWNYPLFLSLIELTLMLNSRSIVIRQASLSYYIVRSDLKYTF